jgi:hypothetical protein
MPPRKSFAFLAAGARPSTLLPAGRKRDQERAHQVNILGRETFAIRSYRMGTFLFRSDYCLGQIESRQEEVSAGPWIAAPRAILKGDVSLGTAKG